ncbi:uncharacterized protein E0L32_004336 [Thyridium curvatum]|uniref:Helicase C-terminal domain-containing protein n=1 Tax=Thyridium curvatum TaxID=1093900 RepID=A0A507BG02_9PEZI|nr:uncharacterized protein E0L32_004336 [Thyridium curvatum]TPX15638.1 hypothetical protein E0L32_004336 [Thyridium curvatum]
MADSTLQKYVAAGCLVVSQSQTRFSDEVWSLEDLRRWRCFLHPEELGSAVKQCAPASHLDPGLQELLLHSAILSPFLKLFQRRWIQFEFCTCAGAPDHGIIRVYVLPDDIDRRSVPRSDSRLRKDLQCLIPLLDVSVDLWQGNFQASRAAVPAAPQTPEDSDDASLLQLFNSIPPPDPHPERVQDLEQQRAIYILLGGTVSGLKTPLYGYQERSAALMLEREFEPGQVLDPRLMKKQDLRGDTFYYDEATATVLRTPRSYGGISGGILAEEMGAGKTLICLAIVMATKEFPAEIPAHLSCPSNPRPRVGSLADMAAAVVTRNSIPWRLYLGDGYTNCADAIQRNPGWYLLPSPPPRRQSRHPIAPVPSKKIYLSATTLVIVPANLVKQWEQEIRKHTEGLKYVTVSGKKDVPTLRELLRCDLVLFSIPRFEKLIEDRATDRTGAWELISPLSSIHFKRVIVDEGHKLGNSRISRKSNLLLVLECLHISARWIVTGTPSTGLFGLDDSQPATPVNEPSGEGDVSPTSPTKSLSKQLAESSNILERRDLERIGSMASLYLKARPWANTIYDEGDTPADWSVYVMQPQHSSKSAGRKDCLLATLNSLIIRHPKSQIGDLLPPVDEKIVVLDGSYQDKLCLNLFSMMIIFNAVQSQRTDQDYFFHKTQRSSLAQLVHNIRQTSFFGGSFFSTSEIEKAVETAEKFLEEKKVLVTADEGQLLREAIAVGKVAARSRLKALANAFHEVPVYVSGLPGGDRLAEAWSLDSRPGGLVCTSAPLLHALQKALRPCLDAPHSLQVMLNDGRLVDLGWQQRLKAEEQLDRAAAAAGSGGGSGGHGSGRDRTLAGNTKLGEDSPKKGRAGLITAQERMIGTLDADGPGDVSGIEVAEPLAKAQIVSTASAKLSYLIDSILRYKDEEQIIVFYENDNVAFYLAGMLEVLQIHHLIYAKTLTTERRAQYIDTFNHNPKFRVLLMDITQAAFGLDMRSASRIYMINPVLNPQVEAQAIGRVRRISQKRRVSVETLVLRGSLEELIVERRRSMTQAEHRRCKSILDDPPIFEWIRNARILPLGDGGPRGQEDGAERGGGEGEGGDGDEMFGGPEQMAPLRRPQYVFGREFGRVEHPDEGLVGVVERQQQRAVAGGGGGGQGVKRARAVEGPEEGGDGAGVGVQVQQTASVAPATPPPRKPKKARVQVRFAGADEDE